MEYHHRDRLKAFRNLYAVVADGEEDFYDAKEKWEKISDSISEEYFWMAVEDSYRNDMLDIDSGSLSSKEFDLSEIEIDEQEWREVTVSEVESMASERAPVYTDHFRRHDDPDFDLGYPVSEMVVEREVEKGDKEVHYRAENSSESDFWIRLDVSFKVPELSEDVQRLFDTYADDYIGKIWSDEMEPLEDRDAAKLNPVRQSSSA